MTGPYSRLLINRHDLDDVTSEFGWEPAKNLLLPVTAYWPSRTRNRQRKLMLLLIQMLLLAGEPLSASNWKQLSSIFINFGRFDRI